MGRPRRVVSHRLVRPESPDRLRLPRGPVRAVGRSRLSDSMPRYKGLDPATQPSLSLGISLRHPLQLVCRQRPTLDRPGPFLGSFEECRTSAAVDLGELLVAPPLVEPDAEVDHRGELVLAGPGDRLGVLAATGMRSTSGVGPAPDARIVGSSGRVPSDPGGARTSRAARSRFAGSVMSKVTGSGDTNSKPGQRFAALRTLLLRHLGWRSNGGARVRPFPVVPRASTPRRPSHSRKG